METAPKIAFCIDLQNYSLFIEADSRYSIQVS